MGGTDRTARAAAEVMFSSPTRGEDEPLVAALLEVWVFRLGISAWYIFWSIRGSCQQLYIKKDASHMTG